MHGFVRCRRNLSSELNFSKEHRDINVKRIGFVASEITKNRGIAICAPIAPYEKTRAAIRRSIEAHGGFIEVHMATPPLPNAKDGTARACIQEVMLFISRRSFI